MKSVMPSADAVHDSRKMSGRDPNEANRVATPLELLFDLTFATAFGLAASQYAQALAEARYQAAFLGFGFASFSICWAWVNFTWFASAYDTDDGLFRVTTMVQMIGVLVLAMGLPRMFASARHGGHIDNSVMVFGYVIMRVALVSQWLRAAKQDPARRRACLTYAICISLAQIGWVTQLLAGVSLTTITFTGALVIIELAGPVIAERKDGGTPWHAHHIAERYSLFALIALGEGVVGTVAALSAVVDRQGWTIEAALVCIAGVGLTFGMWWVYYLVPSAEALHANRSRAFAWGFAQLVVVASIVATGAGLRVAAEYIERKAYVGPLDVVLSVATPVAVYIVSIYAVYSILVRQFSRRSFWLLVATLAVITFSVGATLLHVEMSVCLAILVLAPLVSILSNNAAGRSQPAP